MAVMWRNAFRTTFSPKEILGTNCAQMSVRQFPPISLTSLGSRPHCACIWCETSFWPAHETSTDLSGAELVKILCKHQDYRKVNQEGSHVILETNSPCHHRLAIPVHNPLRVGTLNAILRAVAEINGSGERGNSSSALACIFELGPAFGPGNFSARAGGSESTNRQRRGTCHDGQRSSREIASIRFHPRWKQPRRQSVSVRSESSLGAPKTRQSRTSGCDSSARSIVSGETFPSGHVDLIAAAAPQKDLSVFKFGQVARMKLPGAERSGFARPIGFPNSGTANTQTTLVVQ